ncbi:MAG: hypothetical protein ACYDAR_00770 [Thermomicrobiales bacterium]
MKKRTKTMRRLGLGVVGITVALLLGACGGGEGTPEGRVPDAATAPTGTTAAGVATTANAPANTSAAAQGEQGGGDAPTTTYTDPAGQFHFLYPQTWGKTTQAGESIRFTGADEFISVTVTTTTQSPVAFAQADAAALTASSPGFKGAAVKAYKVAGTNGAMVAYTWELPKSAVTGKPVPSSGNRYYIPGPGGKVAIFTYSSPTRTYDPAGADDFANTFKWR